MFVGRFILFEFLLSCSSQRLCAEYAARYQHLLVCSTEARGTKSQLAIQVTICVNKMNVKSLTTGQVVAKLSSPLGARNDQVWTTDRDWHKLSQVSVSKK